MIRKHRRLACSPLATAVLLVAGIAALVACGGAESEPAVQESAVKPVPIDPAAEGSPGGSGPAATGMRTLVVEVYFPSAAEHGLVAEAREIFATSAPGDRAKQIVADLISGPTTELAVRGLPRNTRLRQIYVLENGVAYLDFSDDLREGIGGGSSEELLAVYSIVNSVVLNVPEIRHVSILINSKPIETLNGHMDLRWPLRPDSALIVSRVTLRQPQQPDRDAVSRAGAGDDGSLAL